MADALPAGYTTEPIAATALPAGYTTEPIGPPSPRTIGKPTSAQSSTDLSQAGIPFMGGYEPGGPDLAADNARLVLHALPYVTALLGPEGLAAGAAVQGAVGAGEEFGVQTLDKMQGKRKDYDWPAVGWAAGWNGAFSVVGTLAGRGIAQLFGAGMRAAQLPASRELIQRGEPVTPAIIRGIAQKASDEVKAKTMLDSLGQRLGMTEEESAQMVGAYDQGRQVGDAVFQADRHVSKELGARYDAILLKHAEVPVDASAVSDSIDESKKFLADTNNAGQVRPNVMKTLDEIRQGTLGTNKQVSEVTTLSAEDIRDTLGEPPAPATGRTFIDSARAKRELSTDLFRRLGAKVPGTAPEISPPTVADIRGWQSELRSLQRTKNLTPVEEGMVTKTESAINRTITAIVEAKSPGAAAKLAEIDKGWGIYSSNFRTFWKALKDKKSLSEVSDAIYEQMGKRPDALRYMLQAADRAGRSDDMRQAFLNKMWRESQTAGGAVNRATALKAFISKFAPGAKGQDILQNILGKQPGITDSVTQFSQRLEEISTAQKAIKDPALASRLRRVMQYRMILGFAAGSGLGYGAFHKDPVKAGLTGLAVMGGVEMISKVATNPALNRLYVEWLQTNAKSPLWIERGMRLVAQATKAGLIQPQGQDNETAPAGP